MKKQIINAVYILAILILAAKISNWFIHFNTDISQAINMAMFCFIGIAYLFFAATLPSIKSKIGVALCGLFLISMNLIPQSTATEIVGIVCIIIPMVIKRFSKEAKTAEAE